MVRLHGTVTVADYLGIVEAYREHPYDWPCYHIYDYSALEGFDISADDLVRLRTAVKSVRQSQAPLFAATIDTSKVARRLVSRLLTHRVSPFPMESFISEEGARLWIERRLNDAAALRGQPTPAQVEDGGPNP